MKTKFRQGELNQFFANAERDRPTPDDVCVSADGRRLDTPEKLIAFLHELDATRGDDPVA